MDRNYYFKALPSNGQLSDRVGKMRALGLPPSVELFIDNIDITDRALFTRMAECCLSHPARYMVHVPLVDAGGKYYDLADNDGGWWQYAVAFARETGSRDVVLHYTFGLDRGLSHRIAQQGARAQIAEIARQNSDIHFHIENYGPLFFQHKNGTWTYPVCPLDHFFPWEMEAFDVWARVEGLNNVGILLDTAHCALSSNMFNLLKNNPLLRGDRRFSNISDDDLKKVTRLDTADYLRLDFFSAYHLSDALIIRDSDSQADHGRKTLTEGLPMGKGEIDFAPLFKAISHNRCNPLLVLEIHVKDFGNAVEMVDAVHFMEAGIRG